MPSTSHAGRWAVVTLTVALLGVLFLITWVATDHVLPPSSGALPAWVPPLVTMISYGVAGAVLIDRRPDLPFGWLLGGVTVAVAVSVVVGFPAVDAFARGDDGAAVRWGLTTSAFEFLPIAVQGLVNVRFPSGRTATRRGAALEWAIVVCTALVVLGGVFGGTLHGVVDGAPPSDHPLTGGTAVGRLAGALVWLAPVVVLLGLVAGLGVVWRFHRAEGIARQQLKWRAVGVVVALVLFPLAANDRLSVLNAVDGPLFVLTLAVPVLRYRLWAIDTVLRRSVGYASVTVVVVLGYVAVTAVVADVVSQRVAAPVAAALVAVSFAPVRHRVQRMVDRLFFGDRSDPYRTLREVRRRINAIPEGDVLGSLVQAVGASLRLPYVAIERPDGTRPAVHGVPGSVRRRWPLIHEQRQVGVLVASPRGGEDAFDERDQELLRDVAEHLGVAVHAAALTAELLRSRQRLVTAREEERRRLRRDLHDGLGPVLTAVGLNLDAARARLAGDTDHAERHIVEARAATTQALADLRRLVHDLRPPALDHGLVSALSSQVDRLRAGSDLAITVQATDVPELPAAVEVAVLRIALEAVTNAVRHSSARSCRVRLGAEDGALRLSVADDGGSSRPWVSGVGLTTMLERAEELGGTLRAGPGPAGGSVTATFPLPQEAK